jgi:membrane-bound lytic murein transglycosylase D
MGNAFLFKYLLTRSLFILILFSVFIPKTLWASFLTSSGKPLPASIESFPVHTPETSTLGSEDYLSGSVLEDSQKQEDLSIEQDVVDPMPYHGSFPLDTYLENETLNTTSADVDQENEDYIEKTTYDVPIVLNESVEGYLNIFQTRLRDRFTLWLARSGRYLPMMRETFKRYGLPEDLVYVALIESGFNPYAYSRARAVGPWQFMKGTARLYKLRINRWVDERRDPVKSTDAAARHLKDLYERFGSWPLALASYNAGQSRISRALTKAKADDYWDLRSSSYIRRETKGYVPKFMAATIIAKNPQRYGFSFEYHEPFIFDQVTVPPLANLQVIAKAAGINYKTLKKFNPELRTEITPPKSEYTLRLPPGKKEFFSQAYAKIPDQKKLLKTRYIVKRNDSLSTIAQRYGTTVSQLARINNRSSKKILRVGEGLLIPLSAVRATKHIDRKAHVQVVSHQPNTGDDVTHQHQVVYRVQTGDTLSDIARSFKIRLEDLMRHNGKNRRSRIYPGDLLILGYKP